MLITPAGPTYSQSALQRPRSIEAVQENALPVASADDVQLGSMPSDTDSPRGSIKWGPWLGLIGGVGLSTGVAASGLGWVSAVPAFVVGGAAGLFLAHEAVDAMISNGRDSSGTGPISAFAGVVGGLGSAIGAASLAFQHGSPMTGLGLGLAATTALAAGGAYLNFSSK